MNTNQSNIPSMSLNQIRKFSPCNSGWKILLAAQGGNNADMDKQIPLLDILKSNGIADAIWCMRVNWFQHKELYMKFVNGCSTRTRKYSSTYAADVAADYVADADADADAVAAASAAYAIATLAADVAAADAYIVYAAEAEANVAAAAYAATALAAAERAKQTASLRTLLINAARK